MNRSLIVIVFCLCLGCNPPKDPLTSVIDQNSLVKKLATNPAYEVQIIYTQIDRDAAQKPTFTTYRYQLDSSQYFYPASTVKLPASLVALEKLNKIEVPGLHAFSRMAIDSAFSRQMRVAVDSTAPGLAPSIGHYIRKVLITSDNDAYNRLYEFLGQDYLNDVLHSKGYTDSRIIHRLSLPRTPEENLHSNPMRFYEGDSIIYEQELVRSTGRHHRGSAILRGVGYELDGAIIDQPFDFQYKNEFPLDEQHRLLQALFFPDLLPQNTFQLTADDYAFVYKNMGLLPGESGIKGYEDQSQYWDSYVKFLMYGSQPDARIPANIRIFNKIGQAYGYLIDNAYVVDFDNGVEFMLSAVIHVNANRIFNDGVYEYDSLGFPFMEQLGQAIYQLELEREKAIQPDLSGLEALFD